MKYFIFALWAWLPIMAIAAETDTAPPPDPEQIKQEIRDRLRHERELRAEIRDRLLRLPAQERALILQEINPQRGPPPGFGPNTGAGPGGFGRGYEGRNPR
jgi:hypothetical protein